MTVSLAPLSATDIAAIETTQLQFAAAFLRRDFDALAALYTDDAVVMPPNEPAVHGRTALKAWMAAFPVVTDFTLSTGRIEGRADLAYVRGTYTMTLRPEGAETPVMVCPVTYCVRSTMCAPMSPSAPEPALSFCSRHTSGNCGSTIQSCKYTART